jgi:K+-transporting ATPase KdpF subunit
MFQLFVGCISTIAVIPKGGSPHGFRLSLALAGLLVADDRNGAGVCEVGRAHQMTWLYLFGGAASVGLLIYLVVALLQPEKFS